MALRALKLCFSTNFQRKNKKMPTLSTHSLKTTDFSLNHAANIIPNLFLKIIMLTHITAHAAC